MPGLTILYNPTIGAACRGCAIRSTLWIGRSFYRFLFNMLKYILFYKIPFVGDSDLSSPLMNAEEMSAVYFS